MTRVEFIERVAADAERVAQDALAVGFPQLPRGDSAVLLVRDVARALSQKPILSRRTQATRLATLLRELRIGRDQLSALADVAREFPPHLRVTVANAIPAHARLAVYSSRREPGATAREATDSPRKTEAERPVSTRPRLGEERPTFSTVLLLSHPDRQEANRTLLTREGFDPVVVESRAELERALALTNVCGCAIDESALTLLDAAAQESILEDLAGYSSFIAIRVHQTPALLVSSDRAVEIVKSVRQLGTPVPYDALSFRTDSRIQAAELSFYRKAASVLQSHESTSFVLGDLSLAESHLLAATARARLQAERPDPEIDPGPLTVRFLPGGHSEAKLATIACEKTATFVTKIMSKDLALDEMRRFRAFVQPWNDELRPVCHFHKETAVIVFGLVRSDSDPSLPAESLKERLDGLWNRQWMQEPTEQLERDGLFLAKALTRVARTLSELNTLTPPPGTDLQSFVNPPVSHLDALQRDGFVWGLSDCAMEARTTATKRIRRMATAAVVHGDFHLRNVLIRGESEVHLIDYAASGPGHPALDLVRFELALYLGPVRHFDDEATSVAFQEALSIECATPEGLRRDFPDFFQCHVNSACATGMTEARDAALEVLQSHGGDRRDYLAMKFLVAWQSLGIIGPQAGLARAIILATADEIAAW